MHISFSIESQSLSDFIDHWSAKYVEKNEEIYTGNVGKKLTKNSRKELFEWKNGSVIAMKKWKSILKNYPLSFSDDVVEQEERYLDHNKGGGAIWNIFYLHCINPEIWPIYDQHAHRAMIYMKTGKITEIGGTNRQKIISYKGQYVPFFKTLSQKDHRKLDKALFAFGKFLKTAGKYA